MYFKFFALQFSENVVFLLPLNFGLLDISLGFLRSMRCESRA